MSIKIMSEVFEKSQTEGNARLVLLSIADCCNDEASCWPSIRKIALKCNLSEVMTRKYINALSIVGVLTKDEREDGSGRQTSNLYTINCDKIGSDLITKEIIAQATSPSRTAEREGVTGVSRGGGNAGYRGEGVTGVSMANMNHHKESSNESPTKDFPESGNSASSSASPTVASKETPPADAAKRPSPDCAAPLPELEANKSKVNQMFRRRDNTVWSDKERKALENTLGTTEEEWETLIEYYSHAGEEGYYCRTAPLTAMNNWAGEIDKAKLDRKKKSAKPTSSETNKLAGGIAGREDEFWTWVHSKRPWEERRPTRAVPEEWVWDFLNGTKEEDLF
jgi:hypothetical protein